MPTRRNALQPASDSNTGPGSKHHRPLVRAPDVERAIGRGSRTAGGVPRRPAREETTVTVSSTYKDAPTEMVDVGGAKFAYRQLGADTGVPVIFLSHLGAVLDNWDPRVVDGIAARHRVITFDNRGVGASDGSTPDSIAAMAQDAVALIRALGFDQVDLVGFSLGGFITQVIAQQEPQLVRKIVLAGTGPAGGEGIDKVTSVTIRDMIKGALTFKDPKYYLFFTRTANGRLAARQFLEWLKERTDNRDRSISLTAFRRQLKAIHAWGRQEPADLTGIQQWSWWSTVSTIEWCPAVILSTWLDVCQLPNSDPSIVTPDTAASSSITKSLLHGFWNSSSDEYQVLPEQTAEIRPTSSSSAACRRS